MDASAVNISLAVGIWIANMLLAVIAKILTKSSKQIAEMHVAHLGVKATDSDGRPKWWFPEDLREFLGGILQVQEKVITVADKQDDMMCRIEVCIARLDEINAR